MSISKLLEKDEVWLQCTPEGDYDMADAEGPFNVARSTSYYCANTKLA